MEIKLFNFPIEEFIRFLSRGVQRLGMVRNFGVLNLVYLTSKQGKPSKRRAAPSSDVNFAKLNRENHFKIDSLFSLELCKGL